MKISYQHSSLPGQGSGKGPGPVGRLLAVVAAAVVIASALILGFVFFMVIFGLLLFAWIAFVVRGWFLTRGGSAADRSIRMGGGAKPDTLEGEFEVIDRKEKDVSRNNGNSEGGG